MGKSTGRGRSGRGTDVFEIFPQPHKSKVAQVLGLLIRARAELFLIAVTTVVVVWLRSNIEGFGLVLPSLGRDWSVTVLLAVVVAAVFAVPYTRRFLVARMWCVVDRHRLRTCLRQTKVRTMNMDGSLPFMLWARPTKTGERIWLWIRAGSSGDDIEAALSYIAPACFAREARLHRLRKLTTLIAVDVIRRDPLTRPGHITSALTRYVTEATGATRTEGSEPIRAATVADITSVPISDTGTESKLGSGKTKKIAPSAAAAVSAPAVVVNGQDLSDYID